MKIRASLPAYHFPVFLICLWGVEYRGISLPTFSITISIILSLIYFKPIRNVFNSPFVLFGWFVLFLYLLSNLLISREDNIIFSNQNYAEDIYSLLVLMYFYVIGEFYQKSNNKIKDGINISILMGVAFNLFVCVMYYGYEWPSIFVQRLWNPYLLLFVPIAGWLATHAVKKYYFIPVLISLFLFSISIQISLSVLIVILIMFLLPDRLFATGRRLFGVVVLGFLISLQLLALKVDPLLVVGVDHNSAVRMVFWREAFEYFLEHPWGMGFGVSVVSGDMSLIDEPLFHGGHGYEDLGVHSGIMSLVYRFGLFSILIFFLFSRKILFRLSGDLAKAKIYVSLLFLSLLSFFC